MDRINQETPAVAVDLADAAAPFMPKSLSKETKFDRHAGVSETSGGLYLFPTLVDMSKAGPNTLLLPEHLRKMLPEVIARDPTTTSVFLAEDLKPKATGKNSSTREMTATGVWSERDTRESSEAQGRAQTEAFVTAAVQFIETLEGFEANSAPF